MHVITDCKCARVCVNYNAFLFLSLLLSLPSLLLLLLRLLLLPLFKLELQRQQLLADRQQFQRDQLKAAEMRSLQSPTLQPQTPLQLPPVRPPHRSPPHGSKTAVPVPTQTETKPEGKDSRGGGGESKPAETGEVKSEAGVKPAEKEGEKKEGSPAIVQSDLATKEKPEVDPAPVAKHVTPVIRNSKLPLPILDLLAAEWCAWSWPLVTLVRWFQTEQIS